MIKSEHALKSLEKLMEKISRGCELQMHGSYRYPVYSGWKASMRYNKDLHILYIRGGKGAYIIEDGQSIALEKGVLFMNSPGMLYRGEVDTDTPLEICGIRFGLYDNKKHISHELKPFYCSTLLKETVQMDYRACQLHSIYHNMDKPYKHVLCSSYLNQMIWELGKGDKYIDNRIEIDDKINVIKGIIEKKAYEKFKIGDIANEVGISMRYLQKRFKVLYGITPKGYAMQIAMDRAYSKIAQGKMIKEVALEMGYSDMYAFSRQFKKYYGYSPSYAGQIINQES